MARLGDVRAFLPCATDEADTRGLHDLRIAVKRLRYALEFLGPAWGKRLRDDLARAEELQEALGQVTDCDAFIRRLCALEGAMANAEEREGLGGLVARAEAMRHERYQNAKDLLARLDAEDAWGGLERRALGRER